MDQQNQVSPEELDARIMTLISQRNRALDESVILNSRGVVLEKQIQELKATIVKLNEQLAKAKFEIEASKISPVSDTSSVRSLTPV